jgi:hypothetical protein
MTILDAKQCWLDLTTEEEVEFGSLAALKLRRPKKSINALASLTFGEYKDLSGCRRCDDRVIWLDMIVSKRSGDGARLLKQICRLARDNGLAICGCPTPVKPMDWLEDRWFCNDKDIVAWYQRQDFKIVQDASETRVWKLPPGLALSVQVQIV